MVDPISARIVVDTGSFKGMSQQQEPENAGNLKRTNRLLNGIFGLQKLIVAENAGGILKQIFAFITGGAFVKGIKGGGLGGATISGALGAGAVLGGASLLGLGGIAGAAGFDGIQIGAKDVERSTSEIVNQNEDYAEFIKRAAKNFKDGALELLGFKQKNEDITDAQIVLKNALLDAASKVSGRRISIGTTRPRGPVILEGTFQGDVQLGSLRSLFEDLPTGDIHDVLGPIIAPRINPLKSGGT